MKIYKVRLIDPLGKEVAEFGFYESRRDAMVRLTEVAELVKSTGTLEIRTISVVPDSDNTNGEMKIAEKDYYELKPS